MYSQQVDLGLICIAIDSKVIAVHGLDALCTFQGKGEPIVAGGWVGMSWVELCGAGGSDMATNWPNIGRVWHQTGQILAILRSVSVILPWILLGFFKICWNLILKIPYLLFGSVWICGCGPVWHDCRGMTSHRREPSASYSRQTCQGGLQRGTNCLPSQKLLKFPLKKSRIYPFWGQSEPRWHPCSWHTRSRHNIGQMLKTKSHRYTVV